MIQRRRRRRRRTYCNTRVAATRIKKKKKKNNNNKNNNLLDIPFDFSKKLFGDVFSAVSELHERKKETKKLTTTTTTTTTSTSYLMFLCEFVFYWLLYLDFVTYQVKEKPRYNVTTWQELLAYSKKKKKNNNNNNNNNNSSNNNNNNNINKPGAGRSSASTVGGWLFVTYCNSTTLLFTIETENCSNKKNWKNNNKYNKNNNNKYKNNSPTVKNVQALKTRTCPCYIIGRINTNINTNTNTNTTTTTTTTCSILILDLHLVQQLFLRFQQQDQKAH